MPDSLGVFAWAALFFDEGFDPAILRLSAAVVAEETARLEAELEGSLGDRLSDLGREPGATA